MTVIAQFVCGGGRNLGMKPNWIITDHAAEQWIIRSETSKYDQAEQRLVRMLSKSRPCVPKNGFAIQAWLNNPGKEVRYRHNSDWVFVLGGEKFNVLLTVFQNSKDFMPLHKIRKKR